MSENKDNREFTTFGVLPNVVDVGGKLLEQGDSIVYEDENGDLVHHTPEGVITVLEPGNMEQLRKLS